MADFRWTVSETKTVPKVLEFTSPDSATTIYACGWCRLTTPTNSREAAEACCRCTRCHDEPVEKYRVFCAACGIAASEEREAELHAKAFVDAWARYFEAVGEAAEYGFDMGHDVDDQLIVYPCKVGRCHVPSLVEHIEETWAEEFDDPDMIHLAKPLVEKLHQAETSARKHAPEVWRPDLTKRVVLEAVVFDDE